MFIINNNVYGVIRKRQNELFRYRTIGTDPTDGISCPDFEKVAYAFEIPYQKIQHSSELKERLYQIIKSDGPVLCEITGLENQDYIQSWHTHNVHKRFVNRPIEDQAPFIDRNLFLSEMIIEPIDQ